MENLNELDIQDLVGDGFEIDDIIVHFFPVACEFTFLEPSEDSSIHLIPQFCKKISSLIYINLKVMQR